MTVQQLIRQLLNYPAESEVVVGNNTGYANKVQAVSDVSYPYRWDKAGTSSEKIMNEPTVVVELFLEDECFVQEVVSE